MGIEIALAAAALAVSAAGAYTAYDAQQTQAKQGRQAMALRQEELAVANTTSAIQAKEQENERQKRADIAQSSSRATAAAFGLDAGQSGSTLALEAANENALAGDVGAIRLMGSTRQRQFSIQGQGARMQDEAYKTMGDNAWVRPTVSFMGSALGAYNTYAGSVAKPETPAPTGSARS